MLTFGSLFSGIGAFDLGLERAGMRCLWQCEIDGYCQRVLAKHWPSVLRVPDVRGVNSGTVPLVDVVCGGFPCQDLSYAGKGAGLAGERSGLWHEYARVVGDLRPRYVIVENVAALLARGLDRVLGDLAEIGYDAEWDCIPAAAVGAPHRRDRLWIVAYPNGRLEPQEPEGDVVELGERAEERRRQQLAAGARAGGGVGGGFDPAGAARRRPLAVAAGHAGDVADADVARLEGHGRPVEGPGERASGTQGSGAGVELRHADHWAVEPDVGRVAHGTPQRVDRLRALGNALVPQIPEWIGRRILEWEGLT